MNCLYCKKGIPDGSGFCNWCGRKQVREYHRVANGSGNVFKRGQTYTARVRVYRDGILKAHTKGGFKTKREAYDAISLLFEEVKLGRREKIGFCDLWRKTQETERFIKLSADKQSTWKYAYDKCSSLYGVKDIREIKYEHLQAIVEGLTYYPARDVKVLLNAMYQLAMKMDLCEKNYASLIELPKLETTEKDVFTEEELKLIWNCQDPFCDYILIMCYCGLRPVEMRKLRTEDLHLRERYMTGGQKTELSKKSRIAIPDFLIERLEHFKPFTLGKNMFERYFAKAIKNAGIERELTPGCCRHTFVTRLTEVEDSAAVIQKAARHTKYQTTLNYTHMKIDDTREAVNKLRII